MGEVFLVGDHGGDSKVEGDTGRGVGSGVQEVAGKLGEGEAALRLQ